MSIASNLTLLYAGVTVTLDNLRVQNPVALSIAESDEYSPCALHPDFSPDAVFVWVAEESDTLRVEICSVGYEQRLKGYEDGTEVGATTISEYEFQMSVTKVRKPRLFYR